MTLFKRPVGKLILTIGLVGLVGTSFGVGIGFADGPNHAFSACAQGDGNVRHATIVVDRTPNCTDKESAVSWTSAAAGGANVVVTQPGASQVPGTPANPALIDSIDLPAGNWLVSGFASGSLFNATLVCRMFTTNDDGSRSYVLPYMHWASGSGLLGMTIRPEAVVQLTVPKTVSWDCYKVANSSSGTSAIVQSARMTALQIGQVTVSP